MDQKRAFCNYLVYEAWAMLYTIIPIIIHNEWMELLCVQLQSDIYLKKCYWKLYIQWWQKKIIKYTSEHDLHFRPSWPLECVCVFFFLLNIASNYLMNNKAPSEKKSTFSKKCTMHHNIKHVLFYIYYNVFIPITPEFSKWTVSALEHEEFKLFYGGLAELWLISQSYFPSFPLLANINRHNHKIVKIKLQIKPQLSCSFQFLLGLKKIHIFHKIFLNQIYSKHICIGLMLAILI